MNDPIAGLFVFLIACCVLAALLLGGGPKEPR